MSRRLGHLGASAAAALAALVLSLTLVAGTARASTTQFTIFQDDTAVLKSPVTALRQIRALGATTLRFDVPWQAIAPHNASWTKPRFNATDPAAYGTSWAPYDAVIVEAHKLGLRVDLDLAPGAPRWATGRIQPHDPGYPHWQWEVNTAEFGQFVKAIGERYSGDYDPLTGRLAPGSRADLPRVGFWSIWNEPNYGPSLAPQALPGHPGVENSPRVYRQIVDQAWASLADTGHTVTADTILIGELAPRSQLTEPNHFTDFNGMTPMVFLENFYCLDTRFHPLRGAAATLRGCPATAAGSRSFAADNPALFKATGVSDHPYDEWFAPDEELDIPKLPGWALENTQDTSLATIGVLERGLDRLTAAYGVHEQLPIYDTEYGYQTSPPRPEPPGDPRHWPSPTTAGYYDNWAEYIHYKNPRIKSFAQYLLQDSVPVIAGNGGGFPSGLVTRAGQHKADYDSFRMPLYMPRTQAATAFQRLEVWGGARPSFYAGLNFGGAAQTVRLLYRPLGSHTWSTLRTLALNPEGYYDTYVSFPASGTLKAEWSVPAFTLLTSLVGVTMDSRSIPISVH